MAKPAVPVRVPARNPAHTKPTRTWTVEPGDHLWHIAQATLAADLGHSPTDTETFGYWRRLIDANRSHLVDPNNPDLILPGQQLDVPVSNSTCRPAPADHDNYQLVEQGDVELWTSTKRHATAHSDGIDRDLGPWNFGTCELRRPDGRPIWRKTIRDKWLDDRAIPIETTVAAFCDV